MPSDRNETVQALKNLANLVMSVLTMLLQVSMQMIEGEIQQDSADLTQHLEQMYGQLDQQRTFLQALINHQQGRSSTTLHNQGPPETTNAAAYRQAMAQKSPTRSTPPRDVLSKSSNVPSRIAGIPIPQSGSPTPVVPELEGCGSSVWEVMSASSLGGHVPLEDMQVVAVQAASGPATLRSVTPGNISIHEWGQKVIAWGKKHPGKTFAEVLRTDPGYFSWISARYTSLPPNQQEFVDYCRLKLEIDAEA